MTLFILTLFHTGYKLRTSTLYHLLVGKRTSSVLIHGFFYQNLAYLGALPTLKEKSFQEALNQLKLNHLITIDDEFGELTPLGKARLLETPLEMTGLNNMRFGRMREDCWQLILFAIQVTSYLSFNEKEYLPIENRPYYLQQVKKWLAQSNPYLLSAFKDELTMILNKIPSKEADFLANQFSGHGFQGKTVFQLLPDTFQEYPWVDLYQQRAIDLFLEQIEEGELSRLLYVLDQQNMNLSMLKTKDYFLAGKTVSEILSLRHLKQGTVNDHFIEWALLDKAFPFEKFEQLDFDGLHEGQVINSHYQEYEVSYLNFRLSQIYYLREHGWN